MWGSRAQARPNYSAIATTCLAKLSHCCAALMLWTIKARCKVLGMESTNKLEAESALSSILDEVSASR